MRPVATRVRWPSLTLLMLAVWGSGLAQEQGLILHKQSRTDVPMSDEEQVAESTMYLGDRTLRQVDSKGEELIILHDQERFIRIDHREETYSEVSFAELRRKLDEVSDQITRKSQENQEEIEQLQRMMGGTLGEISVEKEGETRQIAGYRTEKYRLAMPPLTIYLWAAPELQVPGVYYDSMKIHAKPNPLFNMQRMFDAFKKIEGLSLRTEVVMEILGMEYTSVDEVVRVEKGPIPEPAIPESYRKVALEF